MTDYSDLIGKPFGDFGRGPDVYDCWGLVIAAAAKHSIDVPDYGQFHHEDEPAIAREFKARRGEWVEVPKGEKPQVGNLILFKRLDGALHFGMVIEGGEFIQCNKDLGVHICRLNHPIYKHLIQGFYRYNV